MLNIFNSVAFLLSYFKSDIDDEYFSISIKTFLFNEFVFQVVRMFVYLAITTLWGGGKINEIYFIGDFPYTAFVFSDIQYI